MNLIDATKSGFADHARFPGRARRSEFWFWILFTVMVGVVASVLDSTTGLALHLIGIIPVIGTILVVVRAARDSDPGQNQYGPSPKAQLGY